MLINQVIAHARSGELSNLNVKGFADDKIMTYINLALIELYKRFSLRTEEALVTMKEAKTIYKIDGTDADVDVDNSVDFLSIVAVYDEDGAELNVNVEGDDFSILTPSYNSIQVPYPADDGSLSIIYLAGPTYVSSVTQQLEIPISLLEALLHYIGYRAHGAIDGNVQAENNTHYQRFEASCKRAETLGVVTTDDLSSTLAIVTKGFV